MDSRSTATAIKEIKAPDSDTADDSRQHVVGDAAREVNGGAASRAAHLLRDWAEPTYKAPATPPGGPLYSGKA